MNSKNLFLFLFASLFIFQACESTSSNLLPSKLVPKYITGHTAGDINPDDSIRIVFATDLALEQQKAIIKKKLFRFHPKTKGEGYFSDSRTYVWKAAGELEKGKTYTATLDLKPIYPELKKNANYQFALLVKNQSLQFHYLDFGIYSNETPDIGFLRMEIQTALSADPEQVEKMVEARMGNKKYNLSWQHSMAGKKHIFTVDSMLRDEKDTFLIVAMDVRKIGIKEKNKLYFKVLIPKQGVFGLLSSDASNTNRSSVKLVFSDNLDPNQDFESLVYIPGIKARISVSNNTLYYYPSKQLFGQYKLILHESLHDIHQKSLGKNTTVDLNFLPVKPEVVFNGEGVILPNSTGLFVPISAINLNAVRIRVVRIMEDNILRFLQENDLDGFKNIKRVGRLVYEGVVPLNLSEGEQRNSWNDFTLDLSRFFDVEQGAIYQIYLKMEQEYSTYPCPDQNRSDLAEVPTHKYQFEENDTDLRYYYEYNFEMPYFFRDKENPCKTSYYNYHRNIKKKNVLASNLGIIAKRAQNELRVIVTDIRDAKPIPRTEISFYNFQLQEIAKAVTNHDGIAVIEMDKSPFLITATKGRNRGYLRLTDGASQSLSMFDVEGVQADKGVKLYQYAERAIWRPGDSIFVHAIIENQRKQIPEGHPIVCEFFDPRGQPVSKQLLQYSDKQTIYPFYLHTAPDAITGNWQSVIRVGSKEHKKTIKVETIRPNRLKIDLKPKKDQFTSQDKEIQFDLSSNWLHGAKAKYLKADVKMNFRTVKTQFNNYKDYVFDDITAETMEQNEQVIFDGRLDENGIATVKRKLKLSQAVPGKMKIDLVVRVFEAGGVFSIDRFSIPYSPYSHYVGIKVPKGAGWNHSLDPSKQHKFKIVSVDEHGQKPGSRRLLIRIYKNNTYYWWDYNSSRSNYISSNRLKLISEYKLTTKDGVLIPKINLPEFGGNYVISVQDLESGHTASASFRMSYFGSFAGPVSKEAKETAKILNFVTDKERYVVGERVRVKIPQSKTGKLLVSLEKSDRVLEQFWIDTKSGQSEFSFLAREEMTPNVYLSLHLVQEHSQSTNDLPIRLFGVLSVPVNNQENRLAPQIHTSEEWAPEHTVSVQISEKNGKAMEYTLAVVDEGLLSLIRTKTPDPYQYFNAKEALLINTWDVYDHVIGAHSGVLANILAVGGDAANKQLEVVKANRFPPVVRNLGPFKLHPGKKNKHYIHIPNYIGELRVMVVAAKNGRYGNAEKKIKVTKPLMLQAALPRVVGPGEQLRLPVNVFSLDPKIKNVNVKLSTNDLLAVETDLKLLQFDAPSDQIAYFDLKVPDKLGLAKLKIEAYGNGENASQEIELDVRAPNPPIRYRYFYRLPPGASLDTLIPPIGYEYSNDGYIEISNQLPINFKDRLDYLITYPHGCIEQTTSSLFPQLFVDNVFELDATQKMNLDFNIKEGINHIMRFQNADGGFGYWPGEANSLWGTSYAGHFLLEAKKKGYSINQQVLDSWKKYQQSVAENWTYTSRYSDLNQAYRLYTLALAGSPSIGAMNRLKLQNELSNQALWRLAAAYALIGQTELAKNMIQGKTQQIKPYRDHTFTFGSAERDLAMMLETLTLLKSYDEFDKISYSLAEKLAGHLNDDNWYSTQTTAYMLLALSKFFQGKSYRFELALNHSDKKQYFKEGKSYWKQLRFQDNKAQHIHLTNTGESDVFVNVVLSGVARPEKEPAEEKHIKLDVQYLRMDGTPVAPDQITQGEDIQVVCTVTNTGPFGDYENLALTQVFPSAWEIHNDRLVSSSVKRKKYDYRDIRDDRVMSYFSLKSGESKQFVTKINAAFVGRYYLPSTFVEAMYDRSIYALVPGKWIEILPEGTILASQ